MKFQAQGCFILEIAWPNFAKPGGLTIPTPLPMKLAPPPCEVGPLGRTCQVGPHFSMPLGLYWSSWLGPTSRGGVGRRPHLFFFFKKKAFKAIFDENIIMAGHMYAFSFLLGCTAYPHYCA